MKFVPLTDHVLVEKTEELNTTASGIILQSSGDKPQIWIVAALPKDKSYSNAWVTIVMDLDVGDKVFFTKYSPEELDIDGKKYLVLKYQSLLGKMSKVD